MGDPATLLAVIFGFTLLIVMASWLGAGTTLSFHGLWARPAVQDWPRGVQESDAPRFAVGHLDGLRPGQPMTVDTAPIAFDDHIDAPRTELIDLGSRRLDAPRA